VTGSEIVEAATSLGVALRAREGDRIGASPPGRLPPELCEAIVVHRSAVLRELLRREAAAPIAALPFAPDLQQIAEPAPTLSHRGRMCGRCHREDRCYPDGNGFVCPQCVEWEVRGCPSFTVLASADEQTEAERGACLRCGSPWAMHGRPATDSWTRVADPDDAMPATVRFVVARAREVARGVNP
jgi:hypothetical protein